MVDPVEQRRLAKKAAESLLAGDRVGAVATVRSLFSLVELHFLESDGDDEARRAAVLLVSHFMPAATEEAEFLVAFALRWVRS